MPGMFGALLVVHEFFMYRWGLHDVEAIFVIVLPLHLQSGMVIIGHVSLLA